MTESDALKKLSEPWEAPPELRRGRPRPVQWTGTGKFLLGFAVIMALGGLVGGGLLWVKAEEDAEREALLAAASGRADGRITRLWRHNGDSPSCYVAYEFEAGNRIHSAEARVGCGPWKSLAADARVPVRFVATDPAISRLEDLENTTGVPFFAGPLVAIAFVSCALLLRQRLLIERRLLADGRPAQGVVTKIGMHTDKGRYFHCEFQTLGGTRVKGRLGPVRGKALPTIGSTTVVLYDPDNPKRNIGYPTNFVKIRR